MSALVLAEVFAPGSTAAKVVSCVALALQFLGYNAARGQVRAATGASSSSSSSSQAGFIRFDTICLFLFSGAIGVAVVGVGCRSFSGKDAARAGAGAVIDCASQTAKAHTEQYGATVEMILAAATTADGKLDKDTVAEATKGFAAETGWCVVENVLARTLARLASGEPAGAPQASPLRFDAEDARRTLGAIREARYAGVTFRAAPPAPEAP